MEMDERLKNSGLPEIEKIKLHFIKNPEETITMTGRELVDRLIEIEEKTVEVTRGYVKADIEKLDRIANAFRDANHVLKADNARLREALENILRSGDHHFDGYCIRRIAREALKGGN